jgi:cAMP phosphodiesterase
MKIQLLPSTIENGKSVNKQHLACFVIDDFVAIDAGSLSMSASDVQRKSIRDVVLTHAHLDHIAGLPLFIDDHFSQLETPVRVHGAAEILDVLREHIFNWKVYPDFSELENEFGPVLEYREIAPGKRFVIGDLTFEAVPVNHKVPSFGFIVNDSDKTFALSGDTAEMSGFWDRINNLEHLDALFVECAFPDELVELARLSHHLTPARFKTEVEKFSHQETEIFAINLKPVHRGQIINQLEKLSIRNLHILEAGRTYPL